ncbi:GntR family transcriptional regulator, partial [Paenibacillus forsythiae]
MDAIPILSFDEYLAEYRYKYLALYHALRAAILSGNLPGGTRLPSTRKLAVLYGLSRGSAAQVYDMLGADGYVKSETGRGTFVSRDGFFPEAKPAEGSAEQAGGGAGIAEHPSEAKPGGAAARAGEAMAPSGGPGSPLTAGGSGEALPLAEGAAALPELPLSAWARRLAALPPVREEAGASSV